YIYEGRAIGQSQARTGPAPAAPLPPSSGGNPTTNVFVLALLQAQMLSDWTLSEAQKMADGAQMQLAHAATRIEALNATIRETNDRAFQALKETTGQDIKDERKAWVAWWRTKKRGYDTPSKPDEKPVLTVHVNLPYMPSMGPLSLLGGELRVRTCT